MGYTITIGNAKPFFEKCYGELYSSWEVEGVSSEDAPVFPGDDVTGNTNSRSPSYTGWRWFCEQSGLVDLFYDKSDGLLRNHPGCIPLTEEHYSTIHKALLEYQPKATLPPGFEDFDFDETKQEPKYDYILPRLMWLDFWVRWALDNCETPAIRNT